MAHVTAPLNRLHQPSQMASRVHAPVTQRSRVTTRPSAAADSGGSAPGATVSQPSSSGAADFRALFTSQQGPPVAAPKSLASPLAPTPQSVFGSSPWVDAPVGKNPDGSLFGYNPWYFATPQAATQVAQMLGGTVVASNEFTAPGSPFVQQQPNLMVQMQDGRMINAGLVASFYSHGYSQSYIDSLIANQISGINA